jgi:hypothetical protein
VWRTVEACPEREVATVEMDRDGLDPRAIRKSRIAVLSFRESCEQFW